MNKGYNNLQDTFLASLCQEHAPVSIYLVNGIKLQGHVDSFDQYVVMLKSNITQMVYKHAISTIVPNYNVKYIETDNTENLSIEEQIEEETAF